VSWTGYAILFFGQLGGTFPDGPRHYPNGTRGFIIELPALPCGNFTERLDCLRGGIYGGS
jgi:hypothetical protein